MMRSDPAFTEFEMTADQWSEMLDQFSEVTGARKGVMLHPEKLNNSAWTAVEQAVGVSRAKMRTAIALMPKPRLVGLCLSAEFKGDFVNKSAREDDKDKGDIPRLVPVQRRGGWNWRRQGTGRGQMPTGG